MNNSALPETKLVPYHVIQQAVNGDIESILMIVDYYYPYILWCAREYYFNCDGKCCYRVDSEFRKNIEFEFIRAIPKFNLERL